MLNGFISPKYDDHRLKYDPILDCPIFYSYKCIDIIIYIGNNTNIKFENIKISNRIKIKETTGIGLSISVKNYKVTLGEGVEICDNNGNGVYINSGAKLIIAGGKIYNNTAKDGGDIYIRNGNCIFEHDEITGNHAEYGGGIFQYFENGYETIL